MRRMSRPSLARPSMPRRSWARSGASRRRWSWRRKRRCRRRLWRSSLQGLVESAKDCSEGGLAVTLAECGFARGIGAQVDLSSYGLVPEFVLFGEDASRILISCDPQNVETNPTNSGTIWPLSGIASAIRSPTSWKSRWTERPLPRQAFRNCGKHGPARWNGACTLKRKSGWCRRRCRRASERRRCIDGANCRSLRSELECPRSLDDSDENAARHGLKAARDREEIARAVEAMLYSTIPIR